MINKSLFTILLILSIFALFYSLREKWFLTDNISENFQQERLEESIEDLSEAKSEENNFTKKGTYTEDLLEGQVYSFFGTADLASRNLSEEKVKDIILERIFERDPKNHKNIERNLVRTERWPYNKKWFIGKFCAFHPYAKIPKKTLHQNV